MKKYFSFVPFISFVPFCLDLDLNDEKRSRRHTGLTENSINSLASRYPTTPLNPKNVTKARRSSSRNASRKDYNVTRMSRQSVNYSESAADTSWQSRSVLDDTVSVTSISSNASSSASSIVQFKDKFGRKIPLPSSCSNSSTNSPTLIEDSATVPEEKVDKANAIFNLANTNFDIGAKISDQGNDMYVPTRYATSSATNKTTPSCAAMSAATSLSTGSAIHGYSDASTPFRPLSPISSSTAEAPADATNAGYNCTLAKEVILEQDDWNLRKANPRSSVQDNGPLEFNLAKSVCENNELEESAKPRLEVQELAKNQSVASNHPLARRLKSGMTEEDQFDSNIPLDCRIPKRIQEAEGNLSPSILPSSSSSTTSKNSSCVSSFGDKAIFNSINQVWNYQKEVELQNHVRQAEISSSSSSSTTSPKIERYTTTAPPETSGRVTSASSTGSDAGASNGGGVGGGGGPTRTRSPSIQPECFGGGGGTPHQHSEKSPCHGHQKDFRICQTDPRISGTHLESLEDPDQCRGGICSRFTRGSNLRALASKYGKKSLGSSQSANHSKRGKKAFAARTKRKRSLPSDEAKSGGLEPRPDLLDRIGSQSVSANVQLGKLSRKLSEKCSSKVLGRGSKVGKRNPRQICQGGSRNGVLEHSSPSTGHRSQQVSSVPGTTCGIHFESNSIVENVPASVSTSLSTFTKPTFPSISKDSQLSKTFDNDKPLLDSLTANNRKRACNKPDLLNPLGISQSNVEQIIQGENDTFDQNHHDYSHEQSHEQVSEEIEKCVKNDNSVIRRPRKKNSPKKRVSFLEGPKQSSSAEAFSSNTVEGCQTNQQTPRGSKQKTLSMLEMASKTKEFRSMQKRMYRRNLVELLVSAARMRSSSNVCTSCQNT